MCGKDLSAELNDKTSQFVDELKRALELRADYKYAESISLLSALVKEQDVRLGEQVEKAQTVLDRVRAEREQQTTRAQATFEKAKKLTKSNSYERIIGLLIDVPEPLRTKEMSALLSVAKSRRSEILEVSADIRDAVEKKDFLNLFPTLERMLDLVPNHKQANKLVEHVRSHLLEVARRKFAKHQYRDVYELVLRIPVSARVDESQKLLVQSSELAFLMDDLTNAPVVDRVLMLVADRLRKQDPANKTVAELREKLKKRASKSPKDVRFPLPSWAARPKHSHFKVPVDVMGGSARIHGWNALPSQHYRRYPSSFFVACGLALQGLGKCSIPINLAPSKKSLLAGLGLSSRKVTGSVAWGLDLGGSSLKAVKLAYERASDQVVVQACERIEYPKLLHQATSPEDEARIIAESLKLFLSREAIGDAKVCVSLRGSSVMSRFVFMPMVAEKKLGQVIEYEVTNQIPYPIEKLSWGFQQLGERKPSEEEDAQRGITILAAKLEAVKQRLTSFQEAGIDVHIVQSETHALHNFISHELELEWAAAKDGNERKATAIVDVGSDSTNLVLTSCDLVSCRSFSTGGNHFTNALLQPFNSTFSQAEQLKQNPEKVQSFRRMYRAFDSVFSSFGGEIERSLSAFSKEHDREIGRMLVVGGGAHLHGLLKYMWLGPDQFDLEEGKVERPK